MAENRKSLLYAILACIFFAAGAAFNGAIVGGMFEYEPTEPIAEFITDQSPEIVLALLFIIAVGIILLAALVYLVGLSPYRLKRPRFLVYLNFLPVGMFIGIVVMLLSLGGRDEPSGGVVIAAVLITLLIPAGAILLEVGMGKMLLRLGLRSDMKGETGAAMFFLKNSLRFRPTDPETAKRAGLLMAHEGRIKEARGLLERSGEDPATTEDVEVLRAMERVYQAEGEPEKVLEVIGRQRQLRPNLRALDERYLKQCLALENWEEAIAVLEGRPHPLSLEQVAQLHELYLKSGNIAQAIARARQVAQMEERPYKRAIGLHEQLLEEAPNSIEVKIDLGTLLVRSGIEEKVERGVRLLEEALKLEPHRMQVRRLVSRQYMDVVRHDKAEEHFAVLIEQGDPDPETYLQYAALLKAEERPDEAMSVYRKMQEVCETDWRGFYELASMLVARKAVDEAEGMVDEAQKLAPDEEQHKLNRLRQRISRHREEQHLRSLSERASREGAEIEERLNYIRQLIRLDKGDTAVNECDLLLEDHPELLPDVQQAIEEGIERAEHSFRLQDYLSDLYFRQGRYDDMLALHQRMATRSMHPEQTIEDGCRKILSRAPDHMPTRLALSRMYLETSRWKPAIENFESLKGDVPEEDRMTLQEYATYAARRAGKHQQAIQLGMELLPNRADDVEFLIEMIGLLEEAGEPRRAYELYKDARERFPLNDKLLEMEHKIAVRERRDRLTRLQEMADKGELTPPQHFEKAELHRLFKEYQEAIAHYQQASEEEDLHDLSVAKMAVCLCERGMYELADETLDAVELTKENVRRHPEIKNLVYRVGDALDNRNLKAEALKYFKRLFQVDASFRDVVVRLERLGGSI